jgi:glutamate racemase
MDNRIELPIAVIDSGVGGISVLRELIKIMPDERFLYFGDSQNAPYGTKSRAEVLEITKNNLEICANCGKL